MNQSMGFLPDYIVQDTDVKIIESDELMPIRLYIFLVPNVPGVPVVPENVSETVVIPLSRLGADDLAQKLLAANKMSPE